MPSPTPAPPPFVVAEGEQGRLLMAGTPQETPLYVFGSGRPGTILMVLGGVHGNEPAGWLAAERLVDSMRPTDGAVLVIPRANRQADAAFVRTTIELGDLNRSYPGARDGRPMEQMAFEIIDVLREFQVSHVVDMHESWAFYADRPQNGTAYLGQTIATDPGSPGQDLARGVVESVNSRVLYPHEEFFFRERGGNANNQPNQGFTNPNPNPNPPNPLMTGIGQSSLGLPRFVPGMITSLLVEMGQQQALERRIALLVEVITEVSRRVGIAS